MSIKFTGKDGRLIIYDGATIIAGGAEANMKAYKYDASGPSFTDVTTEMYTDDTSYITFFEDTGDKIYVGQTTPFSGVKLHSDVIGITRFAESIY